jgi:hypothetical protein
VPSDTEEKAAIRRDFADAVNMTPAALARGLEREESREVGFHHEGEAEAFGHAAGRRIVEICAKRQADLTEDDYAHMRKVVDYVRRHLAQGGPAKDVATSRWRYSLMNGGHDPLKDG